MSINYLPQPSHPWPAMDPHHHYQEDLHQVREPMFEKSLTPSDVGKLNRIVIPKQHAEKYFPLAGESGLLLSFEDELGKPWRFRYSYWTSSQSYVLTKGWSRYVKEKRLDAGDVIVFQRCHADQIFYIGCRRRNTVASSPVAAAHNTVLPWSPSPNFSINSSVHHDFQLHQDRQMAGVDEPARPLKSKRVRLFGVNLD